MIGAYVVAAVALMGAGAVIGFLAFVSLGIRREEAAHSVTTPTPDVLARGARAASGMHARIPGIIQEVRLHQPGLRPAPGNEAEG